MACVGDDFQAVLIVEGREVWTITGSADPAIGCASCGRSWPEGDEPEDGECNCGAPLARGTAYTCSDCGATIFGYDTFTDHAEGHLPSYF